MNYYALIYETVDDYVERRGEFREMHLRMAREVRERGDLVLGAFDDPVDRALLIFNVDDRSRVEEFARNDPYVVNGLVKKWEIRPWRVVIGQEQHASVAAVPTGAILRQWSARATEAQLPKYLEHFAKSVLPEIQRVPGFLGTNVSVRHTGGEAEIVVETTWRSLEAIRAFAGDDLEAAVVAPEAAALLKDFDRRVRHTEVAISASA